MKNRSGQIKQKIRSWDVEINKYLHNTSENLNIIFEGNAKFKIKNVKLEDKNKYSHNTSRTLNVNINSVIKRVLLTVSSTRETHIPILKPVFPQNLLFGVCRCIHEVTSTSHQTKTKSWDTIQPASRHCDWKAKTREVLAWNL